MFGPARVRRRRSQGRVGQQRTGCSLLVERGRVSSGVCGRFAVRAGFTLIELLTVITIIAILATLLMTTLSSVKRKAREAVCTSNLRQIGLGLHLYLEDYNQRPSGLEILASSKYVGDGKVLACPADRSLRNPQLPSTPISSDVKVVLAPEAAITASPPHVSYQHPLGWTDEAWNRLMQAGTRAGITVCGFHDVRAPSRNAEAAYSPPYGLILRGLLDGSVVRRQVYSPDTLLAGGASSFVNRDAGAPPPSMVAAPDNALGGGNPSLPPWEFFSDDAPPENGF